MREIALLPECREMPNRIATPNMPTASTTRATSISIIVKPRGRAGRCGMRRGCVLGFTAASYGQAPAAAAAALTSVLVALTRMRPLAVISTARSTEFVPTI